jgi:hypothetical protein
MPLLTGNSINWRVDLAFTVQINFFWVAFLQTVAVALRNLCIFSKLGRQHLRIDILRTDTLNPFARMATRSVLLALAGLALMPLLWLNREINFAVHVLPTVVLVLPSIAALFYLPLRHIRRSIATAKRREIEQLCRTISCDFPPSGGSRLGLGPSGLSELNALLEYRRTVQEVNEFPFSSPILKRLAMYLIIPPVSWSGSMMFQELLKQMFLSQK